MSAAAWAWKIKGAAEPLMNIGFIIFTVGIIITMIGGTIMLIGALLNAVRP